MVTVQGLCSSGGGEGNLSSYDSHGGKTSLSEIHLVTFSVTKWMQHVSATSALIYVTVKASLTLQRLYYTFL